MALVPIPVQLLHRHLDFGAAAEIVDDGGAVDGAEATLADEKGAAETARGGFEVGEGEEAEVVGTALGEEVVEVEVVGEVGRRVGVVVRAAARVH